MTEVNFYFRQVMSRVRAINIMSNNDDNARAATPLTSVVTSQCTKRPHSINFLNPPPGRTITHTVKTGRQSQGSAARWAATTHADSGHDLSMAG